MAVDNLKKAMLKYSPQLAKDYKVFIRSTLKRMQSDLGSGLKGVYNSSQWARTFQVVRGNIKKNWAKSPTGKVTYSSKEVDATPYVIVADALNKNAKEYGDRVALDWYNKVLAKLGPLKNVKAAVRTSGDVVVTGDYKGTKVRLDQQRIINVSSRGMLFHQWPSRIYVDGESMSESAYKKFIRGLGSHDKTR